MTKVITFSRTFPKGHRREGEDTYFVEKVWKGIIEDHRLTDELCRYIADVVAEIGDWKTPLQDRIPKYHTIRKGKRWKEGEYFSPRVWSGKPYNSKQIIIAPDIKVLKVWEFIVKGGGLIEVPATRATTNINMIAKNDGLTLADLYSWFNGFQDPGVYQIICWSRKVEY